LALPPPSPPCLAPHQGSLAGVQFFGVCACACVRVYLCERL
jgi:hypothetical protein